MTVWRRNTPRSPGRWCLAALLAMLAGLALPLAAQEAPTPAPAPAPEQGTGLPVPTRSGPANVSTPGTTTSGPAPQQTLDYDAWNRLADRAEAIIAGNIATILLMEQTRAQIADWRAAFQAAQGSSAARIATLRQQIEALGPVPAEGQAEAPEIATRRTELTDQLTRLQAPVIAAEEAYSRADGLIRQIDAALRERQAQQLLKLWPAPVNPQNWPAAWASLAATADSMRSELARNWADPRARQQLSEALPSVVALMLFGIAMVWRGRRWFERLPNELRARLAPRWRDVLAFVASLGQVAVPMIGIYAMSAAIQRTGMTGALTGVLAASLPAVAFPALASRWLGLLIFPRIEGRPGSLTLTAEERVQGRTIATATGLLLAVETLRGAVMDPLRQPESATAVLTYPILLATAYLLFRLGRLLLAHVAVETPADDAPSYRNRLLGILGRLAIAAAVVGPLLASVGYVSAGIALVYPAVSSLSLIGLLFVVQRLIGDLFAAFATDNDRAHDGLAPTLIGFLLALCSVPVFALIWGARAADIAEVGTRLGEGFSLGGTRISPTDFISLAVIFGVGYLATRLFQGALKSTILPRTRLDLGGQNAVVAGTGYVGIFLAGLIAINATGIDLSGLAIVAGALSLGIGFGLQNIVQNFVSGIILLIERPVSEGDWIEVGTTQGIVKAISVRSTRIQTFDRTDVIVPNADLVSGRVTNWTRFNLTGRLILPVNIGIGADCAKVEAILREVAEAQPMVILNPPPLVVLMGFANNLLNYELRVILRDVNFSLQVRTEIYRAIVARFIAEGILFVPGMPEMIIHRGSPIPAVSPDAAEPSGKDVPT